MTEEEMREALAEALLRGQWADLEDEGVQLALIIGDLLGPVRRIAAEELRAIARAGLAATPGPHPVRVPVSYLFDRANTLDPS